MRDFQDAKGRSWTIHVTLGVARQIKSRFDIDLLEPDSDENQISAFAISLNKRLDMLWMLVQDQAQKSGISVEDFEGSMEGPHIRASIEAVNEEFVAFIQGFDPTLSHAFGSLLRKSKDLQVKSLERMERFLDSDQVNQAMEAELDRALDEATRSLREQPGKLFGKPQASSSSTHST